MKQAVSGDGVDSMLREWDGGREQSPDWQIGHPQTCRPLSVCEVAVQQRSGSQNMQQPPK